MKRFRYVVIRTRYWRPGENFLEEVAAAIKDHVEDGDIITISEKAISTAMGNILDESRIKAGKIAELIATYWMRHVWGCFLGLICRLRVKNLKRLRSYPLKEGSIHKEAALKHAGFLQALHWCSEGGIDASNLPYSYVSLPPRQPHETAENIREYIRSKTNRKVSVMIVDTDKTYSIGGFHFTPRPRPMMGIHSKGGFLAYVLGRALNLRRRSTPIAVVGTDLTVNALLDIAEAAHRLRGSGAGATVWDMARRFGVSLTQVSWEMLEGIDHKPIVIFKPE
ncbi:MAG: coenzyme F420-0:L-glutamate ligase [Candidatus Bathyarchaeota archaeon]|nr:coenzyme F420-0:L-glutamate ligase [Candidatus Bathyarchaeota archaeon]